MEEVAELAEIDAAMIAELCAAMSKLDAKKFRTALVAEGNAEAAAERRSRHDAAELLAEVRLAGGTWKRYISEPRRDLVVLRVLCSRGRAMLSPNEGRLVGPSQGGALARLFPAPPGRTRSQKKRRTRGPHLPDELFWRVLQFWRSERDCPDEPEEFATGYGDDMVDIQFHDEESSMDGWTGAPVA